MPSESPNLRLTIRPGMAARSAEEERKSQDVVPRMRIEGGTAARLAEAEARAAAQRPLSIRLQARIGGALPPVSFRGADAADAQLHRDKESVPGEPATSVQENKSTGSLLQRYSRQSAGEPARIPDRARKVTGGKKDFSFAKNDKDNSTTPTSPLQKLRALFLRKLPKTGTPDQEQLD